MRGIALSLLAASFSFGALDRDGLSGVDQIFSAASAGNLRLGVTLGALMSNDQSDLLGTNFTRDGNTYPINSFFTTSSKVGVGLGLGSYTEVSLSLPLYYEYLSGGPLGIEDAEQGDLQLQIKAELPIRDQKVFHLAAVLGVTAPTAGDGGVLPKKLELYTNDPATFNAGSSPFGTGRPGLMGALGATFDFANIDPTVGLRWHLNAGVRKATFVSDPSFENILFGGTALEWDVNTYLTLASELYNESRFNQVNTSTWFDTEPINLTLLATANLPVGFQIHAGVVFGLGERVPVPVSYVTPNGNTDQFSFSTAPAYGMYARVEWSGFVRSLDKDGDGIPDDKDKCPDVPGLAEFSGCPNPDKDGDKVCDPWVSEKGMSADFASVCSGVDKCPNVAGLPEYGGCPATDRDHDGIPDDKDKCPDVPGLPEFAGCPNPDKDGDKICDPWVSEKGLSAYFASVCHGIDKCPDDPEDIDGFQDEDGCPDPDNDKDGICDPWVAAKGLSAKYAAVCHGSDKCPDAPETFNGFQDEDGCPDTVAVKVKEVVKTMILKGVNFRSGSAELTPESFSILDSVAVQLQQNPETEFEVAGHTDDRGNATKNQMLSQARAQTVANYFIFKGVNGKRLKVMGYGSAKPVATNRTGEGRALNRRVELNRIN